MRIVIETIPEAMMRVPGLGDWFYDGETLHVRAVDTGAPNEDFLVAWHELAEAWLCRDRGISAQAVDEFDLAFVAPINDPDAEPGDDPVAPYRVAHRQAMMCEHLLALFLGMDSYGTVR
jgi:hypothetical protein